MEIAVGDFFFHNVYGVGQVLQVSQGLQSEVQIRFQDRDPQKMTVYLLERSAERISPAGFRALTFTEPTAAAKLIKENPVEVIASSLLDFPRNQAKTESLKDYLKPYIPDWDAWWEATQPLLKADPRIDTSNSRLREYALAHEERSQAEEIYQSFRYARLRGEMPIQMIELAHRALVSQLKGQALQAEHAQDAFNFLMQVISLNRYAVSDRLGALLRMRDDKLLSPQEAHGLLVKLLGLEFRLYQIEPYAARRVINELIDKPLGDREISVLSGGMCAEAKMVKTLVEWAQRKSRQEIIERFIIAALTENLPPFLPAENLAGLRYRLEGCLMLAQCLPVSSPVWPDILMGFEQTCQALSNVDDLESLAFVLPAVMELAVYIHSYPAKQAENLQVSLTNALARPDYSTEFILEILSQVDKHPKAKPLGEQIRRQLVENSENRQDNFWVPFLSSNNKDRIVQAETIFANMQKYKIRYLQEIGGVKICEIGRAADGGELVCMIPLLDQLRWLAGKWSWQVQLESLRLKAYTLFLSDPKSHSTYKDDALYQAGLESANQQQIPVRKKVDELQEALAEAKLKNSGLETLLAEKEDILRELRGKVGGDTDEARFEERSRILKELVTSLAEFERFASAQDNPSKDFEGILIRLNSMLAGYKVTAIERLGGLVEFNPQRHRLIESGNTQPAQPVCVVERGFVIRDNKDRPRLLKPALVKVQKS